MHSVVHCSIIYNNKDRKQHKYPLRWMDKYMVYKYNGILFSLIKKRNLLIHYNTDELGRHMLSEISTHSRTNTVWSHLHQECKIVKFIDAESRIVFTGGWDNQKNIHQGVDSFSYARWRSPTEL